MTSPASVTPIYSEPVDLQSRADMIRFLSVHERHDGSYSHNVKLSQLQIPRVIREGIALLLEEEDSLYEQMLRDAIKRFETAHRSLSYEVSGRSGGHMELRIVTHVDTDRTPGAATRAMPYDALSDADLADLDMEDLRDIAQDVIAFDRAIDQLREAVVSLAASRYQEQAIASISATPCP